MEAMSKRACRAVARYARILTGAMELSRTLAAALEAASLAPSCEGHLEAVGRAYIASQAAARAVCDARAALKRATRDVRTQAWTRTRELAAMGAEAPHAWTHRELGYALRTRGNAWDRGRRLGLGSRWDAVADLATAELARRRALGTSRFRTTAPQKGRGE